MTLFGAGAQIIIGITQIPPLHTFLFAINIYCIVMCDAKCYSLTNSGWVHRLKTNELCNLACFCVGM